MTVQIKPLKGFKNYMNGEHNTLSLLVKSDCKLQEHLSNAREKLLASLTSIIDHYNSNHDIYFYHKLQVPNGRRRTDNPKTKAYKTKLDSLKIDLNVSIKDLLRIANCEFSSHFVNITILLNNEELELSKDEFIKLNWKIRSALSKINSEECVFVDDNNVEPIKKKYKKDVVVKPIKKKENDCLFQDSDNEDYKVEPIKKNNKKVDNECLFQDSDNEDYKVEPIKKKSKKDVVVKPIKKKENECLFQDSDNEDYKVEPIKKKSKKDVVVKPIKKKENECLFQDSDNEDYKVEPIKKNNKKVDDECLFQD